MTQTKNPNPAAAAKSRQPKLRKQTNKKWTTSEDAKLKRFMAKGKSWEYVSSQMTNRTPIECRERWQLHHTSKKWTTEEDDLIEALQKQWGNKWVRIAAELNGRSDNDVKNRYAHHTCQHFYSMYDTHDMLI